MKKLIEINFDGLVGPTHHYAGLAYGNVASQENAMKESNPKQAALQGLKKMRLCLKLGLKQGLLLPQYRPALAVLKQLGFHGDEQKILEKLFKEDATLFTAIFSASSMWVANAGTVTPSSDTQDERFHITPANLSGYLHRAIEAEFTHQQFQHVFPNYFFSVHPPLPFGTQFSDEGAANHSRISRQGDENGIHIFVFGKTALGEQKYNPKIYAARQSIEASQAIARDHGIKTDVVFLQQHPDAIDAGVFHNDVIAVGNEQVYLYHEKAYVSDQPLLKYQDNVQFIKITEKQISLKDVVTTYLFNSQLVTLPNQTMALILPTECEENPHAKAIVNELIANDNPIQQAHYVHCPQSMHNGGGPACLRLRVPLTEQELESVNPAFLLDEKKITELEKWVEKYYRDRLTHKDFLDKHYRDTCMSALDELTQVLKLGSIYPFQY